jgi:hypothetical protein
VALIHQQAITISIGNVIIAVGQRKSEGPALDVFLRRTRFLRRAISHFRGRCGLCMDFDESCDGF